MYKSGICGTKAAISLKCSLEPKLLQCLYMNSCTAYIYISIGDKSTMNFGHSINNIMFMLCFGLYFSESKIFPQRNCTLFVAARRNLAVFRGLPNRKLYSEFRELWSGGPLVPCSDMHQSFIDCKADFRQLPHVCRQLSVLPIHCLASGLGANFLYKWPASPGVIWLLATAQTSCLTSNKRVA